MFRIWDIFSYVYKWKLFIMVVAILSMVAGYFYVNQHQTYSAETVIRYIGPLADSGLTANGETIDPYKIISPNVVASALKDLNLNASVDSVIKNIAITPIIPKEQEEIKSSKIKANLDYVYHPVYYSIRYTVGSNRDGTYARDVLDALLNSYCTYYSEKYLNLTNASDIEFDIESESHDYLEIAEIINDKLSSMIVDLNAKDDADPKFRSPTTGLSFSDLKIDYKYLQNERVPLLFSHVLKDTVSQDIGVLLKKYTYRRDSLQLESKSKLREADDTNLLMQKYAESSARQLAETTTQNRNNDNGDITNVVTNIDFAKEKAVYDQLVDKYVTGTTEASKATIDAAYCEKIIKIFSSPNTTVDAESAKALVKGEITDINARFNSLYHKTFTTISDYNRYLAMKNIVTVSAISINETLSRRMYLFLALVVGVGFSLILAIAVEMFRRVFGDSSKGQESL